jgi:hypothetical protein
MMILFGCSGEGVTVLGNPPTIKGKITTDGGALELPDDSGTITFSEYAVDSDLDVEIDVTAIDEASTTHATYNMVSDLFVFGPDGSEFGADVEVVMNYDDSLVDDGDDIAIFWTLPGSDSVFLPVSSETDSDLATVTATVRHFSRGFVGKVGALNLQDRNGLTIAGETAASSFGKEVTNSGDLNGDGCADIVITAPDESNGTVYVINGRGIGCNDKEESNMNDLTLATSLNDSAVSSVTDLKVATGGDVDGDGCDDLIISYVTNFSTRGTLYLMYGRGAACSSSAALDLSEPDEVFAGDSATEQFGAAVSIDGDVNGDGCSDILIGSSGDGSSEAGTVYLIYGRGSACGADYQGSYPGEGESADSTFESEDATDGFGAQITAGDINGDGCDDIALPAPLSNSSAGKVYIYYGRGGNCTSSDAYGSLSSADLIYGGQTSGNKFGFATSLEADLNGDGCNDPIVSVPGAEDTKGQVIVTYGRGSTCSSGLSSTTMPSTISSDEVFTGLAEGDRLGSEISASTSFNGDACSELLIKGNNESTTSPKAYFILGRSSDSTCISESLVPYPTNIKYAYRIFTTETESHAFITSGMAASGDINGDGYGDVVMSSRGANENQGEIYLYFGESFSDNE